MLQQALNHSTAATVILGNDGSPADMAYSGDYGENTSSIAWDINNQTTSHGVSLTVHTGTRYDHRSSNGFKPYRLYSVTGDIHNCRIHEFLPHEQMGLTNVHGLTVIMLLFRCNFHSGWVA